MLTAFLFTSNRTLTKLSYVERNSVVPPSQSTKYEVKMLPGWKNIKWSRGDNLYVIVLWRDAAGNAHNVIGGSASIKVGHLDEAAAVTAESSDGSITLGSGGIITINVENSNLVSLVDDRYFYQLKVTPSGGVIQTILEGYLTCGGEVS